MWTNRLMGRADLGIVKMRCVKTRKETCTVFSSSLTDLELDFEVVIS